MEPLPTPTPAVPKRNWGFHAIKAAAFGMALGALVTLIFGDLPRLGHYVFICTLCSMVIGLGFYALPPRFLDPTPGLSPQKAVLLMQAKWLGICLVLLVISLGLLALFFGWSIFNNAIGIIISTLIALLVTSLRVGQHTATTLVSRNHSLEKAQARASFLAIQAQIQPHTLFNALNTILALIRRNPEDAESATRNLAKLLRRTTTALDQESWPLWEEFLLLEALLELERLRFGTRLRYELTLEEGLRDTPVPPLLLVPLVENSLKHGFRTKVGSCSVWVEAKGRVLRVEDDGSGCVAPVVEGVGLRTVRERWEALGGHMTWPAIPTGCAVELELP